MSTLTQRIGQFTSALGREQIPPAVWEKSKVSLLHNLGVGLAGQDLLMAPGYAQSLGEQGPMACARLLITGRPATPETAAFVNAALMHARAQDDVYFPGLTHAGAIMSPAVLAVAEQLGSSGSEVITALIAGYEAMGAISQGFAKRTTPRGFRASGIYGGFAAAAGVARLLGLDAQATAHALGMAASAASGTNQTWVSGTQEWQMQLGLASRNGILAARLAAAGATAAPDALEGSAGFYRAFLGEVDGVEGVGRDLGQTWRSLDVTYKPFAVCAILQAPVTQAMALSERHQLKASDIAAVRLRLNPAEAAYPGTDSQGPFSDIGATLMSAPFCMALALSERKVLGRDLKRLDDPRLSPLIGRSTVIPDASLGTRSFVLEVDLRNGQTLKHMEQTQGEPFNWNRDEVRANLLAMAAEMPCDTASIDGLCRRVLEAEHFSARQIIDACVVR
jgi:2-methylcitrate dehydratase PrpD